MGDPSKSFGVAIGVVGSSRDVIDSNSVSGDRTQGIRIGAPAALVPTNRPTDGNVVTANLVTGSGLDGFAVDPVATGTIVDGNTASSNGGDGLMIQSASTTVRSNAANDNANYGIEAVAGVTDGGGNTAHGNRGPAQCSGVSCAQ